MATIDETTSPTTSSKSLVRLESQRSRKFSWEEIDDLFSAENIGKNMIRQCMKRLADNHPGTVYTLPTVLDFEFFIKYMEYDEFLHAYFESKSFARACRSVVGSAEASRAAATAATAAAAKSPQGTKSLHLLAVPNTPMSASSIYLSHSSAMNTTLLTNDGLSPSTSLLELASSADDRTGAAGTSGLASLFGRNKSAVVSTLGSSSLKVKSAAYVLGNQTLLDQLEKQSSVFLTILSIFFPSLFKHRNRK